MSDHYVTGDDLLPLLPCTPRRLAKILDLSPTATQYLLDKLSLSEAIHIGQWVRNSDGRYNPLYKRGKGRDAEKPMRGPKPGHRSFDEGDKVVREAMSTQPNSIFDIGKDRV